MKSLMIAIAAKGGVDPQPCLKALLLSLPAVDNDVNIRIAIEEQNLLEDISDVKVVRSPVGTSILKLWGSALANAKSDYVAVLDASCPPKNNWLLSVCDAMEKEIPIFCGAVEYDELNSKENMLGYLSEYAQFSPPVRCFTEFPGNNIVLKSNLLDDELLVEQGFFKTFTLWRLENEQKLKPVYIDDMSITYGKKYKLSDYLQRRKNHGRCFGSTRLKQTGQPNKWVCISFAPFVPLLRLVRVLKWVRHDPVLRNAFFRYFGSVVGSECAWSYGEVLGYCFGDNGVCDNLE